MQFEPLDIVDVGDAGYFMEELGASDFISS